MTITRFVVNVQSIGRFDASLGFGGHFAVVFTLGGRSHNGASAFRPFLIESTVVAATFDAIDNTFRIGGGRWHRLGQ